MARSGTGKDPRAVALGRRGGRKGGLARARSLSPERRSEIAAQAARARWGKAASRQPPASARGAATRRKILDAAQALLGHGGPEAVRLKDVAADTGLSRAAVLYHFGSRLALIEALERHTLEALHRDMIEAVRSWQPNRGFDERRERAVTMFDLIAEVFAERGHARVISGLILAGRKEWGDAENLFRPLPAALHAARTARRRAKGEPLPSYEDSLFGWMLVGVALFGDALFGPILRRGVGLDEGTEGARAFRRWFAEVMERIPPILEAP